MTEVEKERLSIALSADVLKALNVFAASQGEYVYRVLEEFIREGLEKRGTSVEELAKIGA